MVRVKSVYVYPSRSCWEFEGKRYPTLCAVALVDGSKEEKQLEFVSDQLDDVFEKRREEGRDIRGIAYIDNHIYAYLPQEVFALPEKDIRRYINQNYD